MEIEDRDEELDASARRMEVHVPVNLRVHLYAHNRANRFVRTFLFVVIPARIITGVCGINELEQE